MGNSEEKKNKENIEEKLSITIASPSGEGKHVNVNYQSEGKYSLEVNKIKVSSYIDDEKTPKINILCIL